MALLPPPPVPYELISCSRLLPQLDDSRRLQIVVVNCPPGEDGCFNNADTRSNAIGVRLRLRSQNRGAVFTWASLYGFNKRRSKRWTM